MKTRLMLLVGVLLLAFTTQAGEKKMMSGKTFTSLGEYEVYQTDEVSENYKVYIIKYANSEEKFMVRVCKDDKCKNFIVYGDNLELQYQKDKKNVFGMTKVDKQFRKFDKEAIAKRIDREQMFRQKVITTQSKSEKEYLGLIACYLPQVVK